MLPARWILVATVATFLAPALLDVLSDATRAYGYLAPDAFYYFTIAVNWVELGTPTFDQVHPTNGFHPLWQWLLALVYAAVHALGASRLALVPLSVVLGLSMLAGAIVLLGRVCTRAGRLTPLFVLLPVGFWPLSISPWWWLARRQLPAPRMTPLFGTLWNYANGMESALLVLLFAAAGWLYVKRPAHTVAGATLLGLTLGALSLARLDHAIHALALAALPLVGHLAQRDARATRLATVTLMTWAGVLGAYVAYNMATVGRAMPVSGAVKSTFPHLSTDSIRWLLSLDSLTPRNRMYALGRVGSVAFPALVALVYIPFVVRWRGNTGATPIGLRPGHGRFTLWMLATALGTIGLALYDLLFVVQWHVGEWYTPVSVVFVSLVGLQAAEGMARRWRGVRLGRRLAWGVVATSIALQITYFGTLHRLLPWGQRFATFCLQLAPRVVAHYGNNPPKQLSRDDGVVAFATGFPTTSGMGLALDAEAASAWSTGTFPQLLEQRGVDRLTSMYYLQMRGFRRGERSRRVQRYAELALQQRPTRTYEVEYVDRDFGILRALPRRLPPKQRARTP